MNRRIYQQIETKAGFFDPPVYDDALNYHNQVFGTQNDPLAFTFRHDSYQPLTSAEIPSDKTVLPFIVGLLPPSAVVTGRLLDRSATIANTLGASYDSSGTLPSVPSSSLTGDGKGTKDYPLPQYRNEQAFYDKLVEWCLKKGINPVDMLRVGINESGLYPGAKNKSSGAAGLWQLDANGAKGAGLTTAQWADFNKRTASEQLDAFFRYFSNPAIMPPNASRGEVYKATYLPFSKVEGGNLYIPTTVDKKTGQLGGWIPVKKGMSVYDANAGLDVDGDGFISLDDLAKTSDYVLDPWVEDGLRAALANKGVTLEELYAKSAQTNSNGLLPSAKGTSNWATSGSQNANQAQQAQTQTAGKSMSDLDMQRAELNRRYTAAQTNVIRALQISLQQMAATPPLKMLVNPESFKVSSQKIVSDGNWTRNGPTTIEHWGDAQDTISASGRIAGFYAVPLDQPSLGGLSRSARNFSDSYRNFLSLFLIYRNNGGIWLEDFADAKAAQTTKPNNLALVGSVYIYYDSTLYIGSFDSFEVSESDAAPFTLSYSFNFTVRQTFLLDRLDGAKPKAQTPSVGPTPIPTTATQEPLTNTPVAPPPLTNYAPLPPNFSGVGVEDRLGFNLSSVPTNSPAGGLPIDDTVFGSTSFPLR